MMQMEAYMPPKTSQYLITVQCRTVMTVDRDYDVESYWYHGTLTQARKRAQEEAKWESTLAVTVFEGTEKVFEVIGDFAD